MRINTVFLFDQTGLEKIYFEIKCFRLLPWQPWRPAIFMFGLFYIIVTNFSATVHSIEEGVSVTVIF